jgi:class 3 adenylate cyclase/tetratricopeptide (TPR) repeat protein
VREQFEEGTVTILFTDVERSTDLGADRGDITTRELMRAHDEIVRAQILEHAGREIKSLGDGFMVGFTSARRAVSCAVAIQKALSDARSADGGRLPNVRVGLNAGEVVHDDEDMFGTAVAAAARITACANGGQILASDVVRALVGRLPGVEFRDAGTHDLKGFDEEWHLLEVVWQREPVARTAGRTPFVGRDREARQLYSLLDGMRKGKGALALIAGEPGVGKTRLAEEIALEAKRRGYRTLVGRCYDTEAPAPYLPFVELLEAASKDVDRDTFRMALGDAAGEIAKVMPQLRHLYDDIPQGLELPSEQERRYLFNSIGEFVERAASVTPLVVILDDIHWADQPSLALLTSIARRLEGIPVVLLGTYRNMELDLHRPLARTLDELLRHRLAERITLKRMSEEGVRAMLTRLAGSPPPPELVTIIYNESDGNAFFVEELFRHLCEENGLLDDQGNWRSDVQLGEIEVPEGVRLVIGRRLERLDESALKVLTIAAALGRTFEYDLLLEVAGVDEDDLLEAIEQAQRLSLVAPLGSLPSETRYEFVHELIRQTLIGGMSLPRRQRLHLKVAEAMEKLYDASLAERATEILHHLYQAGEATSGRAIDLLLLAGTRAQESAAFEDSLRYFDEALALIDPSDRDTKARALVGVGHAQRSLSRIADAVATWSEALTIYDELGATDELGQVGADMVLQLGWAGKWEELVQIAGRVLGVIGQERTRERALLLAFGAVGLGWAGFYDAAQPMLEEAKEIAYEVGSEENIGQILAVEAAVLYAYARLHESIEVGERALPLLENSNAQWNYATAEAFQCIGLSFLGRHDGLEKRLRRLEQMSERLGFGGGLMFVCRARLGLELSRTIDPDAIERVARRDLEINRDYDLPWEPQSHGFIARALFFRGRLEEAVEEARIAKLHDLPSVLYGFGLGTLFLYTSYAGNREEAFELWKEIEPILPDPQATNGFGALCLVEYAIEGFYALGEDEHAAALYDLVVATKTDAPMLFGGQVTGTCPGIAAMAGRRWEDAERHFEHALAESERLGFTLAHFDAKRFLGDMLLRRGETERGRALLNEARAWYAEVGMSFHERLVDDLLQDTPAAIER